MSTSPTSAVATQPKSGSRIVSLDQFRGYTVVGMLLVNFLGSFEACPLVLRHKHDYCSYADTIMPQFLFAVGFAFRLTFGRRADLQGTSAAYFRVVRRMLGLALVSIVVYDVGLRAEFWEQLVDLGVWGALREPLKRTWFQTLMHIAMTGLWLVPVIRASAAVRIVWMLGSAIVHVALSHWFLFAWNNGSPDSFKGTLFESWNWDPSGNVIDGGPLGFLTWVIPAGLGTLTCDAIASAAGRPKLGRLFAWSVLIMGIGYLLSCGTRMYDVPADQIENLQKVTLSNDPVVPPRDAIERWIAGIRAGRWSEVLAEPPLVAPPHTADRAKVKFKMKQTVEGKVEEIEREREVEVDNSAVYRKWNYWMMSQRAGTLSYPLFCAGFSLAVYVLFYIACDIFGWQLAFFRTFGTNALLAYIVHGLVGTAVKPFIPKDAPLWYATAGLVIFFAISWLFVRAVEKQGAYLRV